ncbi:hypothetical protein ACHAW5_003148 [Stephanodiscus triporus]|uniref:NADPH--hemoprotein reductase n=1 Tax=Stephanodiscus triporus TaxID=2934178 RepID=A0ABD3NVM5_9STRA
MSILLLVDGLSASPSTVIGFGATTMMLLFATYYLSLRSRTTTGGGTSALPSSSPTSSAASSAKSSRRKTDEDDGIIEEIDSTKYPGGRLTVYYGSQTGTAQMFAKQIAREAESRGFLCDRVVDLQDVVDNDDVEAVERSRIRRRRLRRRNGDDDDDDDDDDAGRWDDDAALVRATLADPSRLDPDPDGNGGTTGGGGRSRAIFLMATYGEGEPTDNAQQFVEIMKRKSGIYNIYKVGTTTADDDDEIVPDPDGNGKTTTSAPPLPPSSRMDSDADVLGQTYRDVRTRYESDDGPELFLHDVDYATFGLGNRQYEHYNNMGRFVDASLSRCGARRVAALGLGDDDDDLEGDFENWKDGILWPALVARYVGGGGGARSTTTTTTTTAAAAMMASSSAASSLPPCPYSVEYMKSMPDDDGTSARAAAEMIQTSSRHYCQAVDCTVTSRRELRDPSDPGSTVHIEIDVSRRMDVMGYHTADNLGVLPRNETRAVEAVARALDFDLDRIFRLVPNDGNDGAVGGNSSAGVVAHSLPFPTPCTVRECLERYCDLAGSPRRSDLKQLASYAVDELDRRALLRMSSKEGKAEYKEKIVEAHVGIADIVTRLCPSISCPLEHFIMVCPRLQPRYYTISSSSTVHPTTVHITLAVLETERKNKDGDVAVFRGLCSGYLADLRSGDAVRAFVRESAFRLPREVERPVIMFGPGTGIAPMRAILQERSEMRRTMEPRQRERIGASILYFGCKNRSMDYIYRDELEAFLDEGTLTELHLAFSREKAEKVYVQHLLAGKAEETWRLIRDEKASIFVCGAVRMGADVGSTLQDIISQHDVRLFTDFVMQIDFSPPRERRSLPAMFGPDTGIAPMRAILRERLEIRRMMELRQRERIGASILYIGCKNQSLDYIYRKELEAFLEEETSTKIVRIIVHFDFASYSRQTPTVVASHSSVG